MIWEAYQQRKIVGAEHAAERAERKTENLGDEVRRLGRQVDRLSLACQAMWELLRDHSELEEGHIEAKILEIDLRDGNADGRMTAQVMPCWSCGRNTNSRRDLCVMCGAPLSKPHVFEG